MDRDVCRGLLLATALVSGACEAETSVELDLENGRALLARGEAGPALAHFERARAAAPERFEPGWNRALALLVAGQVEAGWAALEALRVDRRFAGAQAEAVRSFMLDTARDLAEAHPADAQVWDLRRAELDPDSGLADRVATAVVAQARLAPDPAVATTLAALRVRPLGQKALRDLDALARSTAAPGSASPSPRERFDVRAALGPDGPRASLRRAAVEVVLGPTALSAGDRARAEDAVLVERFTVDQGRVSGQVTFDRETWNRRTPESRAGGPAR
ncbi:MAG: hypothetical protein ACOYM9_24140 [Bradymonadia bacterium]|jgi:hypothetical protein